MSRQTSEILLEWLKIQKRIEMVRFEGFTNETDAPPRWIRESQAHVIQEIRNQIKILEDYLR